MTDRRDFIKKAGTLALGSVLLPRALLGSSIKGNLPVNGIVIPPLKDVSPTAEVFGIIDMHSHPSQKLYLLDNLFWKHHYPRKRGDNQFREQIDNEQLQKNEKTLPDGTIERRVMGMITTHYLPEMATARDSSILKVVYNLLDKLPFSTLEQKVETEDMTNFAQLNYMMDQWEIQIDRANKDNQKKGKGELLVIARNYKEFADAIENGIIPCAHAIEGSHSLGRIKPNEPHKLAAYLAQLAANDTQQLKEKYPGVNLVDAQKQAKEAIYTGYLDKLKISSKGSEVHDQIKKLGTILTEEEGIPVLMRNLEILKKRGLCLITLAHFFHNDTITYPVFGVSPDELKGIKLHISYRSEEDVKPENGLSKVGYAVVNKMLELGIIVDLTHTNPHARQDIFKLNANRRPLVFSHSGARKIFDKYCPEKYSVYPDYKASDFGDYNVTDDEIMQIQKCNGLIGIIPEVFWLTGCDIHCHMGADKTKRKEYGKLDFHNGIRFMLETIDHIYQKTDTFKNIAIGTDFDGLADAAKNLALPSQFGNLTEALKTLKYKNGDPITTEDICRITSGNALRVLKDGWT
jgi:microsomal dipeptidase-like Zn-dependent dipeptidase